MYDKKKSIVKVGVLELSNYIEGNDLYNSKFIYMFRKLNQHSTYKINTRDFRLDLIALATYGDVTMGELILLYNGLTISELKTDLELKLFKKEDLVNLIGKLTVILSPRDYLKTLS